MWLIKYLFSLFSLLLFFGLIHLNVALYYQPRIELSTEGQLNRDVYQQLQFLKAELHHANAGGRMQRLFPEGFIFIHALYGLSWCETIKTLDPIEPIYAEGQREIRWAIQEMISDRGQQIFPKDFSPPFGAFYLGWTSLLLGEHLALQKPAERDSSMVARFQKNCADLASAYSRAKTPYLSSYPSAAWPADNVVCWAALTIHDQLFPSQYQALKTTWLTQVKKQLDPQTGLIPHAADAVSGAPLGGARGSSQSLMLTFLKEIAPSFADDQFAKYRTQFVDYRFGLPGIREYRKGWQGRGDIDSGPVILQIGGSASIVGVRTMATFGEATLHQGLRNSIEGFGVARNTSRGKKYLFGELPMADAFIAWGNSVECASSAVEEEQGNWRWHFHFISLALLFICSLLLIFIWRKR